MSDYTDSPYGLYYVNLEFQNHGVELKYQNGHLGRILITLTQITYKINCLSICKTFCHTFWTNTWLILMLGPKSEAPGEMLQGRGAP